MKRFSIFAVALLACHACKHTGLSVNDATSVCSHLNAIGCPMPPTCAAVMEQQQGFEADWKPACLAAATTAAQAEACGTVHCPLDGGHD